MTTPARADAQRRRARLLAIIQRTSMPPTTHEATEAYNAEHRDHPVSTGTIRDDLAALARTGVLISMATGPGNCTVWKAATSG